MPRSATDATRFTSTTPHATAKVPPPSARTWSTPRAKPGPSGETPQEKVRRLRAAADAAKLGQISTFDKVIARGRVWADTAHRFTSLTLITATFLAGCVTVYASGDMIIHNRQKRAEFHAEQKARYDAAVFAASRAIRAGTANEAQIEFIKRDKEQQARLAAQKETKKGIFKKSSEWLFSGLKKEDETDFTDKGELLSQKEASSKTENASTSTVIGDAVDIKDKAKAAFTNEKERQQTGGPLDRLGAAVEGTAEPPKSGGWMSFITRRS